MVACSIRRATANRVAAAIHLCLEHQYKNTCICVTASTTRNDLNLGLNAGMEGCLSNQLFSARVLLLRSRCHNAVDLYIDIRGAGAWRLRFFALEARAMRPSHTFTPARGPTRCCTRETGCLSSEDRRCCECHDSTKKRFVVACLGHCLVFA